MSHETIRFSWSAIGRRWAVIVTILAVCSGIESRAASLSHTSQGEPKKIGNADVVRLVGAGLSDDVVATAIEQATVWEFDLSPDALLALKKSGLSDRLILAMQRKQASASRPAAATGGVASAWRGPVNGFRDFSWGDRRRPTMLQLGSFGRMDAYYLPGDNSRVADVPTVQIAYNFWRDRLCSVKIAWLVDPSRRAQIGQQLIREWGPPETVSPRSPERPVDPDFPEWLSQDRRTHASLMSLDYLNDRDYPGKSRPVNDRHLWTLLIEEQKCAEEARAGAVRVADSLLGRMLGQ